MGHRIKDTSVIQTAINDPKRSIIEMCTYLTSELRTYLSSFSDALIGGVACEITHTWKQPPNKGHLYNKDSLVGSQWCPQYIEVPLQLLLHVHIYNNPLPIILQSVTYHHVHVEEYTLTLASSMADIHTNISSLVLAWIGQSFPARGYHNHCLNQFIMDIWWVSLPSAVQHVNTCWCFWKVSAVTTV